MTGPVEADAAGIAEAVERLRAGRLVAFPTETVYGLGADAGNLVALQLVYAVKGRPADNPLILHVAGVEAARALVEGWDARCDALAARFWPGPLTLILRRGASVPSRATGGRDTVAVRCPRHDVAQRLLTAFGRPIAAPSANRSGHLSATTAAHVAAEFGDGDDVYILDGGPCEVGVESTVLDLVAAPPRVLRPGSVTVTELREAVGPVDGAEVCAQDRSPGTALRHYAPRTAARLLDARELASALAIAGDEGRRVVALCFDAAAVPPPHRAIEMPQSAGEYAKRLYDRMRAADDVGADEIVIERPPGGNDMWRAVLDRLQRACAP